MKLRIALCGLVAAVLFATPPLSAQSGWSSATTIINAVGSTTTGTYPATPTTGISTSGSTAVLLHVYSASTSSATVYLEQSVNGAGWYRSATITNPTSVGELWACPATNKMRVNLAVHASGTITAVAAMRTMASDPIGSECKKVDVAAAGSTFSLTSPTFGTQITLDQTTGDYTFTWANPAAARAISIVDPGGTDVFVWRDAAQTLLNKTLTSPTLTTPSLGVATATTVNKVTLTQPASGSTLTVDNGKTLRATHTLTLSGTDSTVMTFPSTTASVARIDAAQTFVGAQTFSGSQQAYATAKALVAATPTIFATVSVASGGRIGGYVSYTIDADDATDFQARSGVIPFSAVNKAGTITCTVGTVSTATEVVAVSASTLTNTFTCSDATGNVMNLLADAASGLTESTLEIRAFVHTNGAATVAYP